MPQVAEHRLYRAYALAVELPSVGRVDGALHALAGVQWIVRSWLMSITRIVTDDSGNEIGCVEMLNRRLAGNYLHFHIDSQRASHGDAVKVDGLTDEFHADKPLFAAIADELMAYLSAAEIIFHNAAFDASFHDAGLRLNGRPKFVTPVAEIKDSLIIARKLFPGKANSLGALCRRLEVDNSNRTLHAAHCWMRGCWPRSIST